MQMGNRIVAGLRPIGLGLGLALVLAGCADGAAEDAADTALTAPACDRACIIDLTDRYVAALAAHDPSLVPLAEDFAFVENIVAMKPGEGLWADASGGPTGFVIRVPDETLQSAGWFGMMEREGKPIMVAIRLKFADGAISQAEHRITEPFEGTQDHLATPRAGFTQTLAADTRMPHDELVAIGASYYDAVDDNDGSLMPFAADCQRRENGITTAGEGAGPGPASADIPPIASDCAGQLSSGVMAYITTISDRFVFAADPVTGLAMGFSSLQHPMDFDPYPVTSEDGTVTMFDTKRLDYEPWDNVAAHVFKVGADGKVHEIEALGFRAPSGAKTDFASTSRP